MNVLDGKAGAPGKVSRPSEKLTHDPRTVALRPPNVERLHNLGIRYQHRPGSHDILLACPSCAGRLTIDEAKPWHHCHGDIRCRATGMTFEQVVEALKAGKA